MRWRGKDRAQSGDLDSRGHRLSFQSKVYIAFHIYFLALYSLYFVHFVSLIIIYLFYSFYQNAYDSKLWAGDCFKFDSSDRGEKVREIS